MEIKTTLEFPDYKIEFDEKNGAILENKNVDGDPVGDPVGEPVHLNYQQIKTGKLFVNLQAYNGYMFLDRNNTFYDTVLKKIYFINGHIFEGFKEEEEKEAFSLFDNYNSMEKKLKEVVDKINEEPTEKVKQKLEENFCEELKKELENYNFNNIKLKNGKYFQSKLNKDDYNIICDKKYVSFPFKNIKFVSQFNYEIRNNVIYHILYGKCKIYEIKNNYEEKLIFDGEAFYNYLTYRGREKFKVFIHDLKEIQKKDNITIYKIGDERMILEMNNKNKNSPVRILIKDINNENIIYEINSKMSEQKQLEGIGSVKDFRTGEILMVNFDTQKIISNDFLSVIPSFIDKDEYYMYKYNLKENILSLNCKNEIIPKKNKIKKIKNEILNIDEIIDSHIEKLSHNLNKKILEKKVEYLGIKNQKYAG